MSLVERRGRRLLLVGHDWVGAGARLRYCVGLTEYEASDWSVSTGSVAEEWWARRIENWKVVMSCRYKARAGAGDPHGKGEQGTAGR